MSDEVIRQACDAAQLSDWIATLPDGIDLLLEKGRKGIGWAGTTYCNCPCYCENAPVVLLDEATSALDGDTSKAVLSALESLAKAKLSSV